MWSVRASPSVLHPQAVVSMHNFSWPGAVAICSGNTFANIYVGYGHKYLPGPYQPPPPPAMAEEYDVVAVKLVPSSSSSLRMRCCVGAYGRWLLTRLGRVCRASLR